MQSQAVAREMCQHYYPDVAEHMLHVNDLILENQRMRTVVDPNYSVYKNREFCEGMRETVDTYIIRLLWTPHEKKQVRMIIWYAYPEAADACWTDYKPPKDSLNRLFLLLGRYNKAIKRKDDLNMKKILRTVVLKE